MLDKCTDQTMLDEKEKAILQNMQDIANTWKQYIADKSAAPASAAEAAAAEYKRAAAEKQADADERKKDLDDKAFNDRMAALDDDLRNKLATIGSDASQLAQRDAALAEFRTAAGEAAAKRSKLG